MKALTIKAFLIHWQKSKESYNNNNKIEKGEFHEKLPGL